MPWIQQSLRQYVMYVRGGDFQTADCNSQFYQRLFTFMMMQELYKYRLECPTQFVSHQDQAQSWRCKSAGIWHSVLATAASHPRRLAHSTTPLREPKFHKQQNSCTLDGYIHYMAVVLVIPVPHLWFVSNSKHCKMFASMFHYHKIM